MGNDSSVFTPEENAALQEAEKHRRDVRKAFGLPDPESPPVKPRTGNIGTPAEILRNPEETRARTAAKESEKRPPKQSAKVYQPGKSWGMLFASLVATPEFQRLRARDLHVLNVIIACRDSKTGESAPGRALIAALTGFKTRTVDRSISALINRGLIRQTREAHWKKNAAFRVAENGEEIAENLQNSAPLNIGAQ
jgi:DNA-binding MarR family transcriptional regulator